MVRRIAKLVLVPLIVLLIALAFFSSSANLSISTISTSNSISIRGNNSDESIVTLFQASSEPKYIVAGGQDGEWWTPSQYPVLYKLSPSSQSSTGETATADFTTSSITTIGSQGTVWSGGFNGTNWLITGWGAGKYLNPFISLYNETTTGKTHLGNYSEIGSLEQEWSGGDIFAVGWNGTDWLLSGMGSGDLLSGESSVSVNHMSMAVLSENGTFTDLSVQIPNNQDQILYANAWNGNYWLVGGGWFGTTSGSLYVLSGNTITDITSKIASAVPTFDAIQSIVWNGKYFLIGGVGFLAEYNGVTFTDLTPQLNYALWPNHSVNQDVAVNAIAWMGSYWLLAGGTPVAYSKGIGGHSAWVAAYIPGNSSSSNIEDITSYAIPTNISVGESDSTILAMSCSISSGCVLGGADNSGGVLLWYNGLNAVNLSSNLNSNTTYVQWVALSSS